MPSTVNLGLTIYTGWTCRLQAEQMEHTPLQLSMPSHLSKQLLKFRTRLAAGVKGNLSIHAKIIYFNAFSLSLFYYVQTHRYFALPLLQPLYRALADFLLKRHWFPQLKLVGLCRWLRLGPLLDPSIKGKAMLRSLLSPGAQMIPTRGKQVYSCWKYWQQQLSPDEIQQLLRILGQANFAPQVARQFHSRFI